MTHKDAKIDAYLEKTVKITFKNGKTEIGFLVDNKLSVSKYRTGVYSMPYILMVGYTPDRYFYDYNVTFYKSHVKKIEEV